MNIILSILIIYILSIFFIRNRCSDRFPFKKQLSDFSTFMVPFNIPAYLTSKIPISSHLSIDYFPELKVLEDNWRVIRDEALVLYENGFIKIKNDLPASSFYKDNRWTSFYLKIYDCDLPSASKLAPKTTELLKQVPTINLALFACLNPGKRLSDHHDPFAFTVRYSLGLSTPNSEECVLIVDGKRHMWSDGEHVIFDETYLHSTYNYTDKPRIILMTDVDRPLKFGWLQKFYFLFGRFFNKMFYIDNVDDSKTGVGNKMTPLLTGYRKLQKGFKYKNPTLYKNIKRILLVIFVILAGFIALAPE